MPEEVKVLHFCVRHSMLYDFVKCGLHFREFRDATTDDPEKVTCKRCLAMMRKDANGPS